MLSSWIINVHSDYTGARKNFWGGVESGAEMQSLSGVPFISSCTIKQNNLNFIYLCINNGCLLSTIIPFWQCWKHLQKCPSSSMHSLQPNFQLWTFFVFLAYRRHYCRWLIHQKSIVFGLETSFLLTPLFKYA